MSLRTAVELSVNQRLWGRLRKSDIWTEVLHKFIVPQCDDDTFRSLFGNKQVEEAVGTA